MSSELARMVLDPCATGGVKAEHLGQVGPRPDDGPDHTEPAENRLEDGQLHGVVLRQRHEHQPAAAAQRCVRLLQDARVCREDHGHVGSAERTDRGDRVGLRGVDHVRRTQVMADSDRERWQWRAMISQPDPVADEAPSIARLHAGIAAAGYRPRGRHHEIYLGDPRRSAPEKLRTILRNPVESLVTPPPSDVIRPG